MNKKTHFLNVHYDFIIFSILKNIHVELLYKKFQVNIRHKKGSISIKLISCCRCLHEAIKANEGAAHCIIYCCSVRISSGFLNFLKKKNKNKIQNIKNYILGYKFSDHIDFMYGHSEVHAYASQK